MTWAGAPSLTFPVVIDANIFIDLHGLNPGKEAASTRKIFLDIIRDRVEVLVTPEMYSEMNRVSDLKERARLKNILETQYPRLPVHIDQVEKQRQSLIRAIGKAPAKNQDRSDLNHIAYTAAAGVTTLVTRDNPVLRRLKQHAEAAVGINLVAPQELVAHIDEAESALAYRPSALLGTGYTLKEASSSDDQHLRFFFRNASGERLTDFESRLRELAARRPQSSRLLLTDPSGAPVALLGTNPAGPVLEVPLARMVTTPLQGTLAAQLANMLRTRAAESDLRAVRIVDRHADPIIIDAVLRDGFRLSEGTATALTIPEVCELAEIQAVVDRSLLETQLGTDASYQFRESAHRLIENPSAQAALSLERQLRPLCIVDAPVDAWLVPIRPHFSSPLFGYPDSLFDRPDELGISVEHVYYRAGRSGETAPARILWYVSGEQEGVVMGRSELVEVLDGPWETTYRQFRRLGVYQRADVEAAARNTGQVRVLRVINTEVFRTPVTLARLKEFAADFKTGLQLQGPSRLDARLFEKIMREASR
ncbi:PIN domain-containing protein [Sanguibacter suarezii]|uniref:PIN domain-containing protein n=1 Tax=Sanguibacter suarezii TaxID=60921 RepID=UPI001FDF4C91|nr:PIN domain-containing protein [Sanguibacter suarezii]